MNEPNKQYISASDAFEKVINEYRSPLLEAWIRLKNEFDAFKSSIHYHYYFWLLRKVFKNKPIRITDYAVLPAPYSDVCFIFYSIFGRDKIRWVYTLDTPLSLDSIEDVIPKFQLREDLPTYLQDDLFIHNFIKKDYYRYPKEYTELYYDFMLVNRAEITKERIIEATRVWLKENYPDLADRKIEWIEPKNSA